MDNYQKTRQGIYVLYEKERYIGGNNGKCNGFSNG